MCIHLFGIVQQTSQKQLLTTKTKVFSLVFLDMRFIALVRKANYMDHHDIKKTRCSTEPKGFPSVPNDKSSIATVSKLVI